MNKCPICNLQLSFDETKATLHVNQCLDNSQLKSLVSTSKPAVVQGKITSYFGQSSTSSTSTSTLTSSTSSVSITKPKSKTTKTTKSIKAKRKDLDDDTAQSNVASKRVHNTRNNAQDATSIEYQETITYQETTKVTTGESQEQEQDKPQQQPGKRCPWYKKLPGTTFTVDAFSYGKIEHCTAYYLTHFHSDHYGGLNKHWTHGPIYCSDVTANLVLEKLKVPAEYVKRLPMNQIVEVDGVKVVCVDANHCPGAVLLLFTIENPILAFNWPSPPPSTTPLRYLHCGDFRAHPTHLSDLFILSHQPFHKCYLDTTYLRPSHTFPSQETVITKCVALCMDVVKRGKDINEALRGDTHQPSLLNTWLSISPKPSRYLIVVGSYLIGKEKLFIALAHALNTKVFADTSKRKILSLQNNALLTSLLTDNPLEAQVHVVNMSIVSKDKLIEYHKKYKNSFDKVVGFRPTGWTMRPDMIKNADSEDFNNDNHSSSHSADTPTSSTTPSHASTPLTLKPQFVHKDITLFGVPYSEHSSFVELQMFVSGIRCDEWIPTVNVGNPDRRAEMTAWINKWSGRMSINPSSKSVE